MPVNLVDAIMQQNITSARDRTPVGLVPCLSVSDELVDGSQLLPILDSAMLGLLSSSLLVTKLIFASKDLVPPHEITFGLNYGSRAAWRV